MFRPPGRLTTDTARNPAATIGLNLAFDIAGSPALSRQLGLVALLLSGTGVVFSAYQTLNHVAAARTYAAPMPRAPPVTTATLPLT